MVSEGMGLFCEDKGTRQKCAGVRCTAHVLRYRFRKHQTSPFTEILHSPEAAKTDVHVARAQLELDSPLRVKHWLTVLTTAAYQLFLSADEVD